MSKCFFGNLSLVYCCIKWNEIKQFATIFAKAEQEQHNTEFIKNSQLNLLHWGTSPPNRSLFYFNIQLSCGWISFVCCLPFFAVIKQDVNPKHHKADGRKVGTDITPDVADDLFMKIEKRLLCQTAKLMNQLRQKKIIIFCISQQSYYHFQYYHYFYTSSAI